MKKTHLARTILCLALVCVFVFNLYAVPAKASISVGAAVTVSALVFVTGALIALGLSPGSAADDFNSIRDNALSGLTGEGLISGDSVTGIRQNDILYFPARLFDWIKSWFHSEEIVVSNSGCFSVASGTSISLGATSYVSYNTDVALAVIQNDSDYSYLFLSPSSFNGSYYHPYSGSYSVSSTAASGGVGSYSTYKVSQSVLDSSSFGVSYDNRTTQYAIADLAVYFLSGAISMYPSSSSSYDVSLGDVAPDNVELSDHYTDWAAGSISVPGTAVGGTSEEEEAYLPIGIGSTAEETAAMSQADVQSGAGTYTGEAVEPEDPGTSGNTDPVTASGLSLLFTYLLNFLTGKFGTLINLLTVVRDWTQNWWDKLGTTFPAILSEWWTSLWPHDAPDTLLSNIRDGVTGVKNWITTWWDDLVTTFPTAMSAWWDEVWTHVDTPDVFLQKIINGITNIRDWVSSWWDTLVITLPQALAKWWEAVWADARSIPAVITDALAVAVEDILAGIRDIFVPSEDFLTGKLEAIKSEFAFADSVIDTVDAIALAISFPGSTPPVIYAHLENAEGDYDYGGTVAILDMNWYAEYKPTVDKLLSAFLWLCFIWKVFKQLPGIVNGLPGDAVFELVHVPGSVGGLPARQIDFRPTGSNRRRLR